MKKILLLGASGYIGGKFKAYLANRNFQTLIPSRSQIDYCDFRSLRQYIRENRGIDFLINAGAKVILGSHLGRPKGIVNSDLSLKIVSERLSELMERPVVFCNDFKDCRYTLFVVLSNTII